MAQVFKLRKARVLCAAVAVALLLVGGEATPVWSLALPLETPTVPVQAPAPPVKTPTLPVKAPTVPIPPVKVPTVPIPPVKVPTVPVKVPTVPVKVPTVPLKTPTVPRKTPTSPVKTTTTVKAPPVSIKTPLVSVKGPSVNVNTPAGSVHTTTGSANVPSVSVAGSTGRNPSSSASGGSSRGATTGGATSGTAGAGSGAGTSGGSAAPASPTPLGTYGSPGAGYGELPPIEGAPGKRARARIARRERLLKATVERFQGCLVVLSASNRQVLELRTGYGDARPLSPRATAALLRLGAPQLARLEKQAVRELSDAAATHSCVRTGEVVEAAMSFIGAGFGGGGQAGTTGRMEVASFKTSRPLLPTPGPTLVGRVLGAGVPQVASDLIVVLLLVTLLGATVVLVVADAAGQGPRHEQWRRRVINRLRALR
jgi:hypothetical protein